MRSAGKKKPSTLTFINLTPRTGRRRYFYPTHSSAASRGHAPTGKALSFAGVVKPKPFFLFSNVVRSLARSLTKVSSLASPPPSAKRKQATQANEPRFPCYGTIPSILAPLSEVLAMHMHA